MRDALFIAVVAAISGCSTRPFNCSATARSPGVNASPASPEVAASNAEPVFVVSDADAVPTNWIPETAVRPISNPYSAHILPNWEQQDGHSVQADPWEPANASGSVHDLLYRVEKPDLQADVVTTNQSSEPANKSPFMLLRLIEEKDPRLRQY